MASETSPCLSRLHGGRSRMELALRRLRFLLLWGLRLTPHQLHMSSARSEPAYALSTAAVALALVCRTYLVARTAPCLCLRATVQLRLHRQSCLNLHFHRSSARSTPACTFSIAVVAPALRVCVVLFCREIFSGSDGTVSVDVRECPPSAVSAESSSSAPASASAPIHTATPPDESPVAAAVPVPIVRRKPNTHVHLTGGKRR